MSHIVVTTWLKTCLAGTLAAAAGADFLCYVTASEHLALPTVEDVHEGVIACRIAAHAGDIVKGVPGAMEKDIAMDPEKARRIRAESGVDEEHGACTICGEFCAYKVMNERKTGGLGTGD